jgi:predicted nucleic acid-binding protein
VSVQVLQEYYVTVTQKLDPGLDPGDARADVRALTVWGPLLADAMLLEDAWGLQDRHALSFWDALIVAAAVRLGCGHVLTEDLQDGQSLEGVTVVNPFVHPVDSVLPLAE